MATTGAKRRNIDDEFPSTKRMRVDEEYHQEQSGQPVNTAQYQKSSFLAQSSLGFLQSEDDTNCETVTSSERRPEALVDVENCDIGASRKSDSVQDDLESLLGEGAGSPTRPTQTPVTPSTTLVEDQELALEAALLQEFEAVDQGLETLETDHHTDYPQQDETYTTEQQTTEPIAPCAAARKKLDDRRNPTAFNEPITHPSKRKKSKAKKEAESAASVRSVGQLALDMDRKQLHLDSTASGRNYLSEQQHDFDLSTGFTGIDILGRLLQNSVAVDEQAVLEDNRHQSHDEHASHTEEAEAQNSPQKAKPSNSWWQPEEEHVYQPGEPEHARFISRLVFKTDEDSFKSLKWLSLDTRYGDIPIELGKRSRDSMKGYRGLDPKDIAEQKRETASQKWLEWHNRLPRKDRPLARRVVLLEGQPDAHYTEGTQWAEKLRNTSGMCGGLSRSKLFKSCEFEYCVSVAFNETVLDESSGVERTDEQLTSSMEQASGRFYEQVLALAKEFPQFRVQMVTVAVPTLRPIQDLLDFIKHQEGGERKKDNEIAK